MPHAVINIKPRAIKIIGVLLVEAPKTSALGFSDGVGDSFLKISLLLVSEANIRSELAVSFEYLLEP